MEKVDGVSSGADGAGEVVISAKGLTKRYGELTAVDGIDFAIRRGECFGFLGPNGAGKTSTMKMITCVSPVNGGDLSVDGRDVRREPREIKSVLGVVSQADSLDPGLSVLQNLLAYARYFDLPADTARLRAWEALDLFQLREKALQKIDELSGGMRRRLLVARALLHGPNILVLDEPTTGLDPQTRLLVWERLRYLKERGITTLLTTHYMEEASYLCDRLVVMDGGRILVEGSPSELVSAYTGDQVLEVHAPSSDRTGLMARLRELGVDPEDRADAVLVYGGKGIPAVDDIVLDGYQVVRRPGNLEDVFLRLTGRGLREE